MKIKVKNLGTLREAEFTLGDLTIICGGNNTGKTYATYALFGFLYTWQRILSIQINDDKIEELLADGVIRIDIQEYVKKSEQIIIKACERYTQELPKIFAAPIDRFKHTEFNISLEIKTENIKLKNKFDRKMGSANAEIFSITKSEESTELVVTLLVEKDKVKIPHEFIKFLIANAIKDIIFAQFFPRPFIASAERTGAAIFRKELNFAKNRLLEEIGQADENIDTRELLLKEYDDYALPIKTNVDFTRKLETIIKGNRGECKRADFIIIADTGKKQTIICIEMKAGKGGTMKDMIAQLQGAKCFVAYCREIGQSFWDYPNFLKDYK
jgi:hypothetical protein